MTYNRASDKYFENQVFTASPQRLRLMLIDGALHYARKAAQQWEQGSIYEGGEAIIGCQRIVTELLRGLRDDIAPDLVANVAAVYNFVFRSLIEAGLKHDSGKLADAMRVLEVERETWRQVCERLGTSLEGTQPSLPQRGPHFAALPETTGGGFAVEA
jgi:flagellar secretion chaperone FliS